MAGFAATIDKWTAETKSRMDAVYGRSVELLGNEMRRTIPQGGRVPFDTGTLARSLLASKNGMPGGDGQPVGLVAASLKATENCWLGYTVGYARRQNYGLIGPDSLGRVYNQQGHYFVENAIGEWQNIVHQAIKDVKSR